MPARPGHSDLDLRILGRRLGGRGVSAALGAWLREHWHRPEHVVPPHPFSVTLECMAAGRVPSTLDRRTVRAALPGFELAWRNRDAIWEWREPDAGVRLELRQIGASIHAWDEAPKPTPRALAALHLAVCEAVRASGLVPLHAAIAVAPNAGRRATALLGASGAGKSTTLLRLMRVGWMPVAEDFGWVDPETLAIYGWDRGVRVWPGTLEAFRPDLAARHWPRDADGKLLLGYRELGATAMRAGTLSGLALLTPEPGGDAGGESDRGPLPDHVGVRALWEAVGVPLTGPAARATAAACIARVIDRVPIQQVSRGHLDIVTANATSGDVSVLLNDD